MERIRSKEGEKEKSKSESTEIDGARDEREEQSGDS